VFSPLIERAGAAGGIGNATVVIDAERGKLLLARSKCGRLAREKQHMKTGHARETLAPAGRRRPNEWARPYPAMARGWAANFFPSASTRAGWPPEESIFYRPEKWNPIYCAKRCLPKAPTAPSVNSLGPSCGPIAYNEPVAEFKMHPIPKASGVVRILSHAPCSEHQTGL